ncbi:hypothetical protein BV20DRAFT_122917 [Pilatotrama ljubarskyi]|nr:hypothetical protein BV20DRAFT_122917 [Pilatotrama ljubarskyi]
MPCCMAIARFLPSRASAVPQRPVPKPQPEQHPLKLPLDVLQDIFEYLDGEPSALCNCALVGHPLLPIARSTLYRSISLTVNYYRNAEQLSDALSAEPVLCTLVKSLTTSHPDLADGGPARREVHSGLLPFDRMLQLRSLTLRRVPIRDGYDLASIVASLQGLEQLNLHHVVGFGFRSHPDPILVLSRTHVSLRRCRSSRSGMGYGVTGTLPRDFCLVTRSSSRNCKLSRLYCTALLPSPGLLSLA